MSRIIRDISKDIKCKIKYSEIDIRKAIERKSNYPSLSEKYYNISDELLGQALKLHDEVMAIIKDYRNKNGEPSNTMLELWDFEHNNLLEDVEEIKLLQNFYKNL